MVWQGCGGLPVRSRRAEKGPDDGRRANETLSETPVTVEPESWREVPRSGCDRWPDRIVRVRVISLVSLISLLQQSGISLAWFDVRFQSRVIFSYRC